MFLSRVEIDTDNRQKLKDLNHVGAYHNWVEQSYPDEIANNERTRKLWRIDTLKGRDFLIIVSENMPSQINLEHYGVAGTGKTIDYEPLLNSINDGLKAQFKVTLNPVISKSQAGKSRGRVMPHITVDQQMNFLLDRTEKNGFLLKPENFSITERGYSLLKKQGQKDIRLSKVTYEGYLTVKNAKTFRKILTDGFGKKKAYGFGLMTIIPKE